VPSSAEPPARREATAREVARRRAVDMLRLAESIGGPRSTPRASWTPSPGSCGGWPWPGWMRPSAARWPSSWPGRA
jgi:hypothetical protein